VGEEATTLTLGTFPSGVAGKWMCISYVMTDNGRIITIERTYQLKGVYPVPNEQTSDLQKLAPGR